MSVIDHTLGSVKGRASNGSVKQAEDHLVYNGYQMEIFKVSGYRVPTVELAVAIAPKSPPYATEGGWGGCRRFGCSLSSKGCGKCARHGPVVCGVGFDESSSSASASARL
jgi:hypothetical protein